MSTLVICLEPLKLDFIFGMYTQLMTLSNYVKADDLVNLTVSFDLHFKNFNHAITFELSEVQC